jgi:hypothetical protein
MNLGFINNTRRDFMSSFITTILYKKQEINQDIIFNFINQLPEKLQAPNLVPEENFIHTDINSEVSAVFYVVRGLPSKVKCFNVQCELFREEALLFLLKDEIKKHQEQFSIYSHLYCDMDGFEENLKLTESSFEEISCMDGEIMRSFREGGNPTEQMLLKTKEQRAKYPIEGILIELGITEQDIINAFFQIDQKGLVLR